MVNRLNNSKNSGRPCVLTIAGFDPSGGAGVLADIKTFQHCRVTGMAAITALTFQNDSEFLGVQWVNAEDMLKQIRVLTKRFFFPFIKIGMIESLDILEKVIAGCQLLPQGKIPCQIIWDPIIRTSSGFEIHKTFEKEKLNSILKKILLITPNTDEIKFLTGEHDETAAAKQLSETCNVFLKGGHSEDAHGRDYLFLSPSFRQGGRDFFSFRPKKISARPKHGTGCALSAALTAYLARGYTLHRSCLKAKDYVTDFLFGNTGHQKRA